MRIVITIILAILMTPFAALSMDLMEDSEMASITGKAERPAPVMDLTAEPETDDTDNHPAPATDGLAPLESNLGVGIENNGHGVDIWLYDVSLDLHIMNISYGDTEGTKLHLDQ